MAVTQKKSLSSGFTQLTITSGETGTFLIPVSPGKYIKFGVNSGHGATYSAISRLAPNGSTDSQGVAITGTDYEEQASASDVGYSGNFNPGIAQVGVIITVAPTSDMVLEVLEGKA